MTPIRLAMLRCISATRTSSMTCWTPRTSTMLWTLSSGAKDRARARAWERLAVLETRPDRVMESCMAVTRRSRSSGRISSSRCFIRETSNPTSRSKTR